MRYLDKREKKVQNSNVSIGTINVIRLRGNGGHTRFVQLSACSSRTGFAWMNLIGLPGRVPQILPLSHSMKNESQRVRQQGQRRRKRNNSRRPLTIEMQTQARKNEQQRQWPSGSHRRPTNATPICRGANTRLWGHAGGVETKSVQNDKCNSGSGGLARMWTEPVPLTPEGRMWRS